MENKIKRFLSLALAIMMVFSMMPQITLGAKAATPDTLYLKPGVWTTDGAWFAAYFFGNGEKWVKMEDSNGDNVYEVTVPSGYPSVIFCRMNPASTTLGWSNKWNQTNDLTIGSNNCYTISGWGGEKSPGAWGTYTYVEPVYYIAGTNNNWNHSTKMTRNSDGTYSVTISNVTGELKFKVTDGTWNNAWGNGHDADGNTVVSLKAASNVTIKFNPTTKAITYTVVCVSHASHGTDGNCTDCGAAVGHPNTTTTTVESTCTVAGSKTVTCDDCGATVSSTELPLAEHNWSNKDGVCANGCGTECAHETYVDGICSVCGAAEPAPAAPATDDFAELGCSDYGFVIIDGNNPHVTVGEVTWNNGVYTCPVTIDQDSLAAKGLTLLNEGHEGYTHTAPAGMTGTATITATWNAETKKWEYEILTYTFTCTEIVEPAISGTFNGALINKENAERTFISAELKDVYAKESVVLKLYDAQDTLLATTSLVDHGDILCKEFGTLSMMIGINCTDSYWDTKWEEGKLRADFVPAYATLYIDGTEMNTKEINMSTTSGEYAVVWGEVPGVPAVPKEISGELGTVYVQAANTNNNNTDRNRLYGEIKNVYAKKSVVVKVYSGETLISTTNLTDKYTFPYENPTLGVNVVISGSTSSSWNTVWEDGMPRADLVPDKAVLYIDGTEMNTATVTLNGIDNLGTPTVWGTLPGVNPDPNAPVIYEVSTKADLDTALAAAKDGDTIKLLADINCGSAALKIERAITLDLGGKTLTTSGRNYSLSLHNDGIIVTNGKLVHAGTVAAIKVYSAAEISNLDIDVTGTSSSGNPIGGIVIQQDSAGVDTIKNVNIYSTAGQGIANGIETSNCGNATEPVIGSMENVTVNAKGNALNISAPVGTATGCSFTGGTNGIEIWIKGTYSASLTLVDCDVVGGVSAHDEYKDNVTNAGSLTLTVDEDTTGASAEDITLTINHAKEEQVGGVLAEVIENAVAKVGGTYYLTLDAAVAAAESGATIILMPGTHKLASSFTDKELTFTSLEGKKAETVMQDAYNNYYQFHNTKFHFENLTITGDVTVNEGLHHSVEATYKNCDINGIRYLFSENVSFEDCVFNSTGEEHAFWTYGASNITVTGCTFNYTDRAVNCYSEAGAEHETDITFTDCTFNYTGTADAPEGAVEINSSSSKSIDLVMNGCTAPAKGDMWFISQWDGKKGANTTVHVDNVQVWPVKPVAKVGSTEYGTIDEAIAAWTNGTTLTLLDNVTLSDVIVLKSTEYHILDLGTYTMTAASKKDAIQIENCGRGSASWTLDIKADATNPGGITATGKAIVRTAGKSGVKDRPIIRFYGGVFNASYIAYHTGSNGTNCPQFYFYGGDYTGTIFTNRTLNQFHGGTFHGSLMMSVDSSAYTLINGGTFKQMSNLYMSALDSGKFTIGSAKGTYDREVYINDDGYYVVAAAKPAEAFEAAIAKNPGTNDYLKYSKVAAEGKLNYTDVYVALDQNKSASVIVYVDSLDLTGTSFKGKLLIADQLTVTFAEGTTPAWTVASAAEGNEVTYTESVADGVVTRTYKEFKPVAQIGETKYETFEAALNAVEDGETITLIEDATGSEISKEIDFTKAISFTITGKAPEYALPVVTFQNTTVTIKDAEILTPELDARQNATINVVDSIVYDAGGNSIVKSYYNGAINISGTSVVYTMQVTTMGYITVSDTAKLNATWQTNVYGNGLITVKDDATFATGALQLTGKEYSGRDNTDAERVGKPATIVVDGATMKVGEVYSSSGADYSYNADGYGINIGTISGKAALLDIKNSANVTLRMQNGGTVNVGADGTVNVNGSTFNVTCRGEGTVTLNNSNIIQVTGESTLNIPTLSGTELNLLHGAVIKDSTVGGEAMLYGNVTFRGDNTFAMLYDYGNAYSTEYAAWTVEKGASVTLTEKARYGLGYGDKVTIYGNLEDALTARENLTAEDASLFTHGLVAMSNWDVNNSLTVKNAYVIIGSNNSFGNSPKSGHVGTFEFNFENTVLDASRITFYKAASKTNFNFNGSDVKVGTFMTRDDDSIFTLTNTKLVSTTTFNGTDEGNYHAGELVLNNSSLSYAAPLVMENGTLTLGAGSSLTAPSISGTGKLIIDATGMTAGPVATISGDASGFTGTIEVINSDMTAEIDENGNIVLVAPVYVAQIGETKYVTFEAAIAAACADPSVTRIDILCDYTQDTIAVPGETYTMLAGQNLTIGADKAVTVTLSRTAGESFSIYLYEGNSSLTIEENVTIEGLDIVANGFATSGNNTTINGDIKAMSLKQWTNNGEIVINGKVELGYGDGQFDMAYGNGTVTIIGNGDKTAPQFKAGYSGSRGNGNTLNLNNTYFEGGAWFTLNGSNVTVNLNNSLLAVSGGDAAGYLTIGAGNVVNVGAGSEIKTGSINGAGKIVIDATGMTAGTVATITGDASGFTGEIEVINNEGLEAKIVDGKIVLVALVAKIGNVGYETLQAALAAVQDGETIELLTDVEISQTLMLSYNSAFDKISITIDGADHTIKAVGDTWTDNTWMVDVAWNVVLKNLIFDANNTGSKGVQFYTSESTLSNVTIKNVSANKWGWTDYAIMNNASMLTVEGALTFENCKHGHMIVDMGSNTGKTASNVNAANATLTGVNVALAHVDASLTAPEGMEVASTLTDYVVVYENGSYVHALAVAQVGTQKFATLPAAAAAAQDGETIKLLTDVTLSAPLVITGKTLDLNELTVTGDVVGTVSINGGNYVTSQGYKMIGADAEYYKSTDAVLTIEGATADITVHSGTLTLAQSWWTGAGQTLTIEKDATFEIPAGMTLNVLSTVIVEGKLNVAGEANLYTAEATIQAVEGLNVATTLADHKVVYENGVYSVKEMSYGMVAMIGSEYFETLDDAVTAAKNGDTIVMLDNAETASLILVKGITLDLNGHIVNATGYAAIYAGNHIVDTVGGGLLEGQYIMIDDENKALPIWDDANGGYALANKPVLNEKPVKGTDSVTYHFLPRLKAAEYKLIAQGAQTSGVTMKVDVSWMKYDAQGNAIPASVTFTYTDALMKLFADNIGEDGTFGKNFQLSLTGTGNKDLTFKVYFESTTGVIFNCD